MLNYYCLPLKLKSMLCVHFFLHANQAFQRKSKYSKGITRKPVEKNATEIRYIHTSISARFIYAKKFVPVFLSFFFVFQCDRSFGKFILLFEIGLYSNCKYFWNASGKRAAVEFGQHEKECLKRECEKVEGWRKTDELFVEMRELVVKKTPVALPYWRDLNENKLIEYCVFFFERRLYFNNNELQGTFDKLERDSGWILRAKLFCYTIIIHLQRSTGPN